MSGSTKATPSTDTTTQAASGTSASSASASTPAATSTTTNANVSTTQPADTTTPAQTAAVSDGLFYGINGHMAWGSGIYKTMPQADQLALLQDLGVTNYRCDIADAGMSGTIVKALKGPFLNSGVSILPVLNPLSARWDPTSTEADAYQLGYDLAVRCTTPLKGLVKYIECGNELDVPIKIGGDGSSSADWSPTLWPPFRGVIRGMIAGVKAVDPNIQCGVNVGVPMAYYRKVKDKYNIQCIMMYAMIDKDFGLIQADGVTKNPAYQVFKDFVAANPV
ncbi:hypothetical protein [Candidatus Burkholderia verschuerenii]|uniref:hypothetical protein n=1 Tax=Candidatus Burkholderia verschuerenii TaxID=242163 RepID=UPI001E59F680|nr:hypothetical protein [Candidatus Burkholderia verschuerenii]